MCGGGGGGQQTTLGDWSPNIAPWWEGELPYANSLKNTPYQQYQGQRIADLHPAQVQAFDRINSLANNGGTTLIKAADDQAYRTLGGNYQLGGSQADPWATLYSTTTTNPYSGMDNPYFSDTLSQGLDQMNKAYQQGTAADTTRAFNLSGAFGGSANQNAVANNQNALAAQMRQYISGMQNDQYNRSANLQENYLNRDLSNQQYNMNKGESSYQAERARQMQMVPQGSQNIQNALQLFNGQLGVGDALRSVNQDYLNQNYNDWQAQKNYPQQQEDWFTGLLSRAMGGMSPSSTTTTSGYQASPFSQLLGGALLAKGLYGG